MISDHIDVLLVEDDSTFSRLIQYAIRGSGITIHTVSTVKDALHFIEKEKVDVILLDLGLPDSTGLDTLQRVYNQSHHTPILIITGVDDMDMALEAVEIGAQDWIIKGKTDSNLVMDILFSIARCKRCEAKKRRLQETILSAFSAKNLCL